MLVWLAGCQPVPQPFMPEPHARENPLLVLPDRAGIVVLDVDGVPPAAAKSFPEAMTRALVARNIPAWTTSGNRGTRFLQGQARSRRTGPGRVEIELIWDLVAPDGTSIGSHRTAGEAWGEDWRRGNRTLIARLAKESAGGIAAFIQDAAPTGPPAPAPVHVMQVTGAPGDGSGALGGAMANALRRAGIRIASGKRTDGPIVAGRVALGPVSDGLQRLEVTWLVRRADGSEIGRLKQRNPVPAGSLDGPWGKLAFVIAEAAAGGIGDLLRREAASRAQSQKPAAERRKKDAPGIAAVYTKRAR